VQPKDGQQNAEVLDGEIDHLVKVSSVVKHTDLILEGKEKEES
jgi:hypothetical protein